jgi:hypothetical protein
VLKHKPRRGRRRTPKTVTDRLSAIETELFDADPLGDLKLLQQRKDLECELAAGKLLVDTAALEDAS